MTLYLVRRNPCIRYFYIYKIKVPRQLRHITFLFSELVAESSERSEA